MQQLNGVVWSTPLDLPRRCGICMHQHSTNNKRRRRIRIRRWHSTYWHIYGAMRGCGLTSLLVCINEKNCDIRERNVTIRSEIWTMNICSLGFWDIREWVTLWRLILHSLGHILEDSTTKETLISLSKSFSKLCLESPHCRIRIRNLVERKLIYPSNENSLVRTRPGSSVTCLTKNHLTRSLFFWHNTTH